MELKNLKTEFLGRNFIFFEEIDSTQEYMKKLKLADAPNGTTAFANVQTAGRGTHSRKWYTTENGNIAMTFVLYPNCNISKFKNLTIDLAQCFIEAIYNLYKINLNIKEPNDIVINNKKLGGILTESFSKGEIVEKIYIGIGFNVNQIEFPVEIKDIASSLRLEFDGKYNREDIISEFFNIFEKKYLRSIDD